MIDYGFRCWSYYKRFFKFLTTREESGGCSLTVSGTDIEGNARPLPANSNPDMGVYENPAGNQIYHIIHVSTQGSNEEGDGSEENPFATIQYGIDYVASGDTVLVHPGIYPENIDFMGKELLLTSLFHFTYEGEYISQTIIDGSQNGSVVTFATGETEYSKLEGFTITNGSSNFGGGIYCDNLSQPILKNLLIIENISICGGGICCKGNSEPIIQNTTITNNSATSLGGGVYEWNSTPFLINCIIWDNSPDELNGSVNAFYSDISGGWQGEGNIEDDPLFANPSLGDYTLQENSPGINAGIDYFEWNGNVLINLSSDEYYGSAPDMGSYEFYENAITDNHFSDKTLSLKIFPNPLTKYTNISFSLNNSSTSAVIKIFNIKGELIKVLHCQNVVLQKGDSKNFSIRWNGTNMKGLNVASGVYLFALEIDKKLINLQKGLLLK